MLASWSADTGITRSSLATGATPDCQFAIVDQLASVPWPTHVSTDKTSLTSSCSSPDYASARRPRPATSTGGPAAISVSPSQVTIRHDQNSGITTATLPIPIALPLLARTSHARRQRRKQRSVAVPAATLENQTSILYCWLTQVNMKRNHPNRDGTVRPCAPPVTTRALVKSDPRRTEPDLRAPPSSFRLGCMGIRPPIRSEKRNLVGTLVDARPERPQKSAHRDVFT